jgi:1-acyl-sn-glycerol-3-phosphate acyltransferase
MSLVTELIGWGITRFTRLVTGAHARWVGCAPRATQRIYFGNHSSHADFALIWSSLPSDLRRRTRPVAGADYWENGAIRRFVIHDVLRGVVIDRSGTRQARDPIDLMAESLDAGDSLILFPEGTRNTTDEVLLPFRRGLYNLALRRPDVELVPVWMENLGRLLPKGEFIPVPLLCSITFGAPFRLAGDETREAFLARARDALLETRASARHERDRKA